MAQRLIVIDGGGAARVVKADRFFVIDGGGVARKIKRLFVIDGGGVARQVYQNATYDLGNGLSAFDIGGSAQSHVQYSNAGGYAFTGDNVGVISSGNWVTPTSAAPGSYTVRFHLQSGTPPSGVTLDTDLALTSTRIATLANSTPGTSISNVLDVTLKDGGVTVATATVTMQSDCP